jgi:Holliday junction resolvase RusA-like endonuclease
MVITLKGRIPSKKNSKRMVFAKGRSFLISSPQFLAWHEEQSWLLRKYVPPMPIEKCLIMIKIFAPDNRKSDLSNKAEGILDLLVENHILKDDNWFCVSELHLLFGGVDKDNPRAEIEIMT